MQFHEYQAAARRTCKPLPYQEQLDHAAMGIDSDFGELVTHCKAMVVYNKPLTDKLREEIKEEAGDCCWFICCMCDVLGLQFDEIAHFRIDNPAYWASSHLGDGFQYWAKAGSAASGKINEFAMSNWEREVLREFLLPYLAYVYVCVCQIVYKCDLNMDEVFEYNIAKLKRRYPDAYSDQAAQDRADKQS